MTTSPRWLISSAEDAAVCMDSFLTSDLRGIRTHGGTHLKGYCERLEMGTTSTGADIEFTETSAHNFKMVILDPAASSNSKFSLQFDCITFIPVQ